jgi:hypothetical protein
MKLAIQISGEFRTLKKSLESLQQYVRAVLPHAQIDFFIHTWRQEGEEGHGAGLAAFKPRSYFLENYADRHDLQALPRAYSMFYSIKRANDARKEYETLLEETYDLVMRYRTDCFLNEPVTVCLQEFLKTRKSFLCIPKAKSVLSCDGPTEDGICDWFAIGTPDTMDVYCGTYTTFQPLELPLIPESMVSMQLKMHGIKEDTVLRRPEYDFFLLNADETPRHAFKESLKSPHGLEER